jgi:hypothetical protein
MEAYLEKKCSLNELDLIYCQSTNRSGSGRGPNMWRCRQIGRGLMPGGFLRPSCRTGPHIWRCRQIERDLILDDVALWNGPLGEVEGHLRLRDKRSGLVRDFLS